MKCKCIEFSRMDKISSEGMYEYSRAHLKTESVDKVAWITIWVCPKTGIRFLQESVPGYKNRIEVPKWTVIKVPE